jgi:ribosomal protein S27AE
MDDMSIESLQAFLERGRRCQEEIDQILLRAADDIKENSITCPKCGMTSYNANDIREGYCGNCHDWTRKEES